MSHAACCTCFHVVQKDSIVSNISDVAVVILLLICKDMTNIVALCRI